MSKTTYIKGKDGKFAGSIGAGKTSVPSASPVLPATVSRWEPSDLCRIPAAPAITDCPDYCIDPHLTADTHASTLEAISGRPSVAERSTWIRPRTQHQLEEEFLDGETGLFTALSTAPDSLAHYRDMHDVYSRAAARAAVLRAEGKHHQAAAVEWVAVSAQQLANDFYDIHDDMVLTNDNEGCEFGAGAHPTILFRDTDYRYAVMGDIDGVIVIDESRGWTVDKNNAHAITEPDFIVPVDTMRADAREMFTGAVIMDYLTLSGGDVEAAAVLSSLTT